MSNNLLTELASLQSEGRNSRTMDLDLLPTSQMLERINEQDQSVALAVQAVLPQIAQAVDWIADAFASGGRLIYQGAGTSGRLGVLDAVECPPTFGVSPELVVGLLAGGEKAMFKAVEGAEDNQELGKQDLQAISVSPKDVLVGIAASGRTPYVLGGLAYARELGVKTVGLSCNPGSKVAQAAELAISVAVGPEALTGSTRMKSGTAQKMVLNMLSTGAMIRSGKSYENLMVDVAATNEKLKARAVRIVMQATACNEQSARKALEQAENQAKLAILLVLTNLDREAGKALLAKHQGFLRKAVQAWRG
ncbi:N-acetylmuramic acid 6-phosphate etherase [Aliiglaciecola sp. CAU 1673]|uniref:N-acetylmuramic acid 6-phosphate etherase n=1 Tax=Aliiglaciecola sp. CAU 1673 TaxID=3032595 RepID=UPI0023DCBFB3|nr:N-acetylmuramic acid 6-phosphate etherase [Aliiglaciecola sp. CAU 1673]MDF2176675.1 N-acetylmuramic acid 6-phosphate etherase [Aliiglaciecola sp. CAU 1673]